MLHHRFHHALGVLFGRHVALDHKAVHAQRLQINGKRLGFGAAGAIVDSNGCATAGELNCDGAANAARRTRDYSDLALQRFGLERPGFNFGFYGWHDPDLLILLLWLKSMRPYRTEPCQSSTFRNKAEHSRMSCMKIKPNKTTTLGRPFRTGQVASLNNFEGV